MCFHRDRSIVWSPRNIIFLFRHEISCRQGHVSFHFGEISSKNSVKQNIVLLYISICILYVHVVCDNMFAHVRVRVSEPLNILRSYPLIGPS
jgi:hypothetical protein